MKIFKNKEQVKQILHVQDFYLVTIHKNDTFNNQGKMDWLLKGPWVIAFSQKISLDNFDDETIHEICAPLIMPAGSNIDIDKLNSFLYEKWPIKFLHKNKAINFLPLIVNFKPTNYVTISEKLKKILEIFYPEFKKIINFDINFQYVEDYWFLTPSNIKIIESIKMKNTKFKKIIKKF